jgi:hypothetical protein
MTQKIVLKSQQNLLFSQVLRKNILIFKSYSKHVFQTEDIYFQFHSLNA